MVLRGGQTQEVGQTSTGIGHTYAQALPFHVSSCKGVPLPPVLRGLPLVSVADHFSLTSHSEHDRKPRSGPLANVLYSQAAPHRNTHFINELAQQLRNCGSVRLLPGPVSEMQDSFRGLAAQDGPRLDHYGTLQALRGQLDQGLSMRGPCVSTTHNDFRVFSRSEVTPPSGLDVPLAAVSLSKSSAHSRLPPHKAPPKVSCGPRLPRPAETLPHVGRHSLYRDSFTVPAPHPGPSGPHPSALLDWGCARAGAGGGSAAGRAGRGLIRDILEVPKMYQTENQTYGGNRIALV